MKTELLFTAVLMLATAGFGQEEMMDFTELLKFLPATVEGYQAGEPYGQTTSVQGLSFSEADVEFTNSEGAYVHISLFDYGAASNLYQASQATWMAGMTYEEEGATIKPVKWSTQVAGWEQYHETERISVIALGIAGRFFVTIEASQQVNTEMVTSIARNMQIDVLASLNNN